MSTGVRALATQTVVITGSTQGLGFGYAREFLARGLNVVVSGRSPQSVARAVEQLAAEGAADRVSGCACDVADLAAVEALWTHAINRFGSVDIWLNNAGYARTGARFADTTPAEIESMVRANVIGSMNAAQVAIAGMQRQGHGKLYLTLGGGGASGRVVPGMSVYSTTKRAVKYFADCLVKERQEQVDSKILVGTISPGINLTEGMLRELNQLPAADRRRALKQLNFLGEHVETTTPWIVERILGDSKQGNDITWLTTGRLLKRALGALFGARRDITSRYPIEV
jgi:NAD(P)-dependent dehydrogenase (short-subunit alcohol dehydrogenase family)